MIAPNELAWRLNQEYVQRLSQARTAFGLLDPLLADRDGIVDGAVAPAVLYTREQLETIGGEHRQWRYDHLYEDPQSRRVVQSRRRAWQAVASFHEMYAAHEALARDLYQLLVRLPRPQPAVTSVVNGDLWAIALQALIDLITFGDYAQQLQAETAP